jgi:putative flavoprotein involved in K+ transport
VILEANKRIGDSWRARWDSLRLFSPARFDGLDGMPFPSSPNGFPRKDEMGDYLEAYADRFRLPVRTGMQVTGLSRAGDRYLVTAGDVSFEATNVVVAMANYQWPRIPGFADELDPSIVQLHSSAYRNLTQLRPGGVLVVGAGNSGSEIALEAARGGHETWMSGRDVGHVPFKINSRLARWFILRLLFRGVFHRVLTLDTPMGRKVRPNVINRGAPLIRVRPNDFVAAGVGRVGRTVRVQGGQPVLEDGRTLDVTNVVWATGYHPGFSWIYLPVFGADGEPVHDRGVARGQPGLYFVGLHFLYAMSSGMIHGVGRDADHVAGVIAQRSGRSAAQPTPVLAPVAASA